MIAAILAAVVAQHGSMPAGLKLVAPDQTLGQLAALIRGARLFIGIDSAPMHMAAAMGTPVVALFGPSSELTWGPWQVQHEVVTHAGKPCRPCGQDGCGGGKISDCLSTLPVERVLAAIDRVDPVSVQA
jgi:heptosyltransferase-3